MPHWTVRHAQEAERERMQTLIALSARRLGVPLYTPAQIEAALLGTFGVDTQLLRDRSYFLIEDEGQIIGVGGWSRRKTLFGGDGRPDRDDGQLDPAHDAARIRAFFIHPDYANRGVGRAILQRCEDDARAHGFRRFALMATLPGLPFYRRCGYLAQDPIEWRMPGNERLTLVPMTKDAV